MNEENEDWDSSQLYISKREGVISHKKVTSCSKWRLWALLTICPKVSSSEGSTSQSSTCPMVVNLGLEFSSRKAEIRVIRTFRSLNDSNLPMGFWLRISSRKKSLKNQAFSLKSISTNSKSGQPASNKSAASRPKVSVHTLLNSMWVRKRKLKACCCCCCWVGAEVASPKS